MLDDVGYYVGYSWNIVPKHLCWMMLVTSPCFTGCFTNQTETGRSSQDHDGRQCHWGRRRPQHEFLEKTGFEMARMAKDIQKSKHIQTKNDFAYPKIRKHPTIHFWMSSLGMVVSGVASPYSSIVRPCYHQLLKRDADIPNSWHGQCWGDGSWCWIYGFAKTDANSRAGWCWMSHILTTDVVECHLLDMDKVPTPLLPWDCVEHQQPKAFTVNNHDPETSFWIIQQEGQKTRNPI